MRFIRNAQVNSNLDKTKKNALRKLGHITNIRSCKFRLAKESLFDKKNAIDMKANPICMYVERAC